MGVDLSQWRAAIGSHSSRHDPTSTFALTHAFTPTYTSAPTPTSILTPTPAPYILPRSRSFGPKSTSKEKTTWQESKSLRDLYQDAQETR